MGRMGGRTSQNGKTKLKPQIEHIRDLEWEDDEIQTAEDLKTIRKQARITKIITAEPDTETWPTTNIPNETLALSFET